MHNRCGERLCPCRFERKAVLVSGSIARQCETHRCVAVLQLIFYDSYDYSFDYAFDCSFITSSCSCSHCYSSPVQAFPRAAVPHNP